MKFGTSGNFAEFRQDIIITVIFFFYLIIYFPRTYVYLFINFSSLECWIVCWCLVYGPSSFSNSICFVFTVHHVVWRLLCIIITTLVTVVTVHFNGTLCIPKHANCWIFYRTTDKVSTTLIELNQEIDWVKW